MRAHFTRLKNDTKEGKVILASRTTNSDEIQFGIVISNEKSWESAKAYMNSDPAVNASLMTATLFPHRVALIKKR